MANILNFLVLVTSVTYLNLSLRAIFFATLVHMGALPQKLIKRHHKTGSKRNIKYSLFVMVVTGSISGIQVA